MLKRVGEMRKHPGMRRAVVAAWALPLMLTVGLGTLPLGTVPLGSARAVAQEPGAAESTPAPPAELSCAKSEFEIAVDSAAEALRDLNNRNRPEFQNKLRLLKEKRAWTDDQFMKEAAPFVKDDQIAVFDDRSNELLASISSMGTEGASAKVPDCAMLAELRRLMRVLIETQESKWSYMSKKLDAELAR